MVASGAGIAVGGFLMLGFVSAYRLTVAAYAARAVRVAVPGQPGWIEPAVRRDEGS